MPNFKQTGRLVGVAALAASTALSGPISAYAQDNMSVRMAQADAQSPLPADQQPAEPAAEAQPAAPAEPVAEQPAPEPEAEEPAPAPEPKAEEPAPAPEPKAEAPAPALEPKAEEPAPAAEEPVEAAPAEEPAAAPAPAAEKPADTAPAAENPAEETAAPAAEVPKERSGEKSRTSESPAEVAPAAEQPEAEAPPPPADAPAVTTPANEPAPDATPDGAAPAASDAPVPVPETPAPGQATGQEAAPAAAPAGVAAPPPADATPPAGETPGAPPAAPDSVPAAPADQAAPAAAGDAAATAPGADAAAAAPRPVETPEPVAADVQTQAVPQGGLAASDARVQQLTAPVEVPSITAEQGQRIAAPSAAAAAPGATDNSTTTNTTNNTTVNNTTVNNTTIAAPQLPPGATVVERVGDRDILSIVGAGVAGAVVGGAAAYFIRGNDDDRIANQAEDRYYEQLRDDRRRQTIVRPNGVQVVTITNRYGDVIQRSKILQDGQEVVLFYDPYSADADRPDYYTDPAADLPPLRLEIPEDQYIVDPRQPDEDLYYRTMVAPPVETVERIYSLDEVRRSQRIRDKVRRIDLSTINFDFGSDAIAQKQVPNLQALAEAIAKIIEENPDETFLIEGHTDAVGKEVANLALSDRRAESIASALTQYFDVPPENLITQGYGESDLKVKTQTENRENRRVTVRRITALVKPVTTARR